MAVRRYRSTQLEPSSMLEPWAPDAMRFPYVRTASLVVAASNSSLASKMQADFVCDGISDNSEIQAAINALSAYGGKIVLAEGTYNVAASVVVTVNSPILILATGARFLLAAGVAGLVVNQGISTTRGVIIDGLLVDGQSNANTVGAKLTDTCWSSLRNYQIENCAVGALFESNAVGNFCEGNSLQDVVIRNCASKGIHFSTVSGTGSFGQTHFRNVAVAYCGTNIHIGAGSSVYRSHFDNVSLWIQSNEVGLQIDGDAQLSRFEIAIEGLTGSTGNTGIILGAGSTNTADLQLDLYTTGVINTLITNNSKLLRYMKNRKWYDVGGIEPLYLLKHGDSAARLTLETRNAGGYIGMGPGNAAQDISLNRDVSSGTPVLRTGNPFTVATYTETTKPAANTVPPGTVIYVSDAAAGSKFQGSNGSAWVSLG